MQSFQFGQQRTAKHSLQWIRGLNCTGAVERANPDDGPSLILSRQPSSAFRLAPCDHHWHQGVSTHLYFYHFRHSSIATIPSPCSSCLISYKDWQLSTPRFVSFLLWFLSTSFPPTNLQTGFLAFFPNPHLYLICPSPAGEYHLRQSQELPMRARMAGQPCACSSSIVPQCQCDRPLVSWSHSPKLYETWGIIV